MRIRHPSAPAERSLPPPASSNGRLPLPVAKNAVINLYHDDWESVRIRPRRWGHHRTEAPPSPIGETASLA
jgi:hypothetical protein